MPTISLTDNVQIGGIGMPSKVTRSGTGQVSHEISVAAGELTAAKSGTLTTRTGNNAGVVTLSGGHGLQTGDKVDVYFAAGVQYNAGATVSGNEVTLADGLGTNLPAQDAAVTVCKRTVIDSDFDGDLVQILRVVANVAGHVHFQEADGTHIAAAALAAEEAFDIVAETQDDNPLASADVGQISVSINDTGTTGRLLAGIVYDSV